MFLQNLCHFSPPGPTGKQVCHQRSGSTRTWNIHHWGCSKLDWTSPRAIWRVFKDGPVWSMCVTERSPEVLSNLKFFYCYMKSPAIYWPFPIIPVSGNNCDTWVMVIAVLTAFMKKAGAPIFTPFLIQHFSNMQLFLLFFQEFSKLHNTSLNGTHEIVTFVFHHLP